MCQFEKGDTDAALAALAELGRARDANVAALAQLRLAGYNEKLGRREEAERLYRQLAEHPAVTVPRATALLALSNLVASSDPAEARKLLEEVKADYPETAIATEATRRLELLRVPPPAATPSASSSAPAPKP